MPRKTVRQHRSRWIVPSHNAPHDMFVKRNAEGARERVLSGIVTRSDLLKAFVALARERKAGETQALGIEEVQVNNRRWPI